MGKDKIFLEVGLKPTISKNDIAQAAQSLQQLIQKSNAGQNVKTSAEAQVRVIEKYSQSIENILNKPKINRNDITLLKSFEQIIRNSMGDLERISGSVSLIANEQMEKLARDIQIQKDSLIKTSAEINAKFRGQVSGITGGAFNFQNANTQLTTMRTSLETEEAKMQEVSNKAQTEIQKTLTEKNNAAIASMTTVDEARATSIKKLQDFYALDLTTFKSTEEAKAQIEAENQSRFNLYGNPVQRKKTVTINTESIVGQTQQTVEAQYQALDNVTETTMSDMEKKIQLALKHVEKLTKTGWKNKAVKKLGIPGIGTPEEAEAFLQKTSDAYTNFYDKIQSEAKEKIGISHDKELLDKSSKAYKDYYDTIKAEQTKAVNAEAINNKKELENYSEKKRLLEDIQKQEEKKAKITTLSPDEIKTTSEQMTQNSKAVLNQQELIDKKKQEIKVVEEAVQTAQVAFDKEQKERDENIAKIQQEIKLEQEKLAVQTKNERESTAPIINKGTEALNNYSKGVDNADKSLQKLEIRNKAFGNDMNNLMQRLTQFTSVIFLAQKAMQKIRESVNVVSDLDAKITQIGIVTKQSTEQIWENFSVFNNAAKELSTTTSQYLEGAKIFYQQGMNTAQVMKMVDATTKAAALSEVSFTQASETLTASINAYNMEASDAMSVTDKFAAVGAKSAADFQELSLAMEKVAASAYSAGMSFDSTLGILAKGIETTREAPEA